MSYPLLRAHAERYGELSLIHFDAHSDTWAEDSQRIDHGTMFYHAAQQGLILPAHSAQIGLRTHNDSDHGFNIFDSLAVHDMKPADLVAQVKGIVGDRPCYLTFDIDCLDPSFAPGTGTPVVGGLSTHQAMQILQYLKGINLVGMDVVEVAPLYDVGAITSLAAATVALQQLCFCLIYEMAFARGVLLIQQGDQRRGFKCGSCQYAMCQPWWNKTSTCPHRCTDPRQYEDIMLTQSATQMFVHCQNKEFGYLVL